MEIFYALLLLRTPLSNVPTVFVVECQHRTKEEKIIFGAIVAVVLQRTQIALPPEFCGQIQQGRRFFLPYDARNSRSCGR